MILWCATRKPVCPSVELAVVSNERGTLCRHRLGLWCVGHPDHLDRSRPHLWKVKVRPELCARTVREESLLKLNNAQIAELRASLLASAGVVRVGALSLTHASSFIVLRDEDVTIEPAQWPESEEDA